MDKRRRGITGPLIEWWNSTSTNPAFCEKYKVVLQHGEAEKMLQLKEFIPKTAADIRNRRSLVLNK